MSVSTWPTLDTHGEDWHTWRRCDCHIKRFISKEFVSSLHSAFWDKKGMGMLWNFPFGISSGPIRDKYGRRNNLRIDVFLTVNTPMRFRWKVSLWLSPLPSSQRSPSHRSLPYNSTLPPPPTSQEAAGSISVTSWLVCLFPNNFCYTIPSVP